MRLFVAVDIGDETRAQLVRVRRALVPQLARVPQPPRVTWVAHDAAHVTLRFIGEVDEPTAERVRQALSTPFERAAFDMDWGGVGRFPRVIWIAAKTGAEEAAHLVGDVNARLDPILGAGENRPFTPHLTVGRIKEPGRGFDWARALGSVDPEVTRSRVDRVVLYQSRTSPKGPTYTAVASTHLHD